MVEDDGLSPADERRYDRLPEQVRRWQRFGNADAAGLAEALALRREIDALAARFSRWQAAHRLANPETDDASLNWVPVTWLHLRRAGLAMVAEIERQRSIGCSDRASEANAATGTDTANVASPPRAAFCAVRRNA